MRHNILPEFENFLISRQLVPKKNVTFYAIWVGKFLSFLDLNRNINEKSTLLIFIEQLKNQGNVKDWQLKQAEAAVKLYKEHFLGMQSQAENMKWISLQSTFQIVTRHWTRCANYCV
jgi:hypothetical protein